MGLQTETIKILRGGTRFMSDLVFPDLLEAKVYTSEIACGHFILDTQPTLPEGCLYFTAKDIPGQNILLNIKGEVPLLASSQIDFPGQPLLVLAAPNKEALSKGLASISISYQEELPDLSLETQDKLNISESLKEEQGEIETTFTTCKQIITGDYRLALQGEASCERKIAIARWEKSRLTVYCTSQNPFQTRLNIAQVLALKPDKVSVVIQESVQEDTDNELTVTILSCLAALVTFHTGKACRLALATPSQRLPCHLRYTTGLNEKGRIIANDVQLLWDTGAWQQLAPDHFRRAFYPLLGAYQTKNFMVTAHAIKTNRQPFPLPAACGSQAAFFALELHVTRLAKSCGMDPISFRLLNLPDPQSRPPRERPQIMLLQSLLSEIERASNFKRKYAALEALNSRPQDATLPNYFYRGIGTALTFYGYDFVDWLLKRERHEVSLVWEKDGFLRVMTSVAELSRGIKRLFSEIVCRCLEIKRTQIEIESLETSKVPDSGPAYETYAITVIGKLLEQACQHLKRKKLRSRLPIAVKCREKYSPAQADQAIFRYPPSLGLSWCATVLEVEIEPCTYRVNIPNIWCILEAGLILDRQLAVATVEREVMNGLSLLQSQPGALKHKKRISQSLPRLYIDFIEHPSPIGPLGAKGIGELPSLGIAPAYVAAVSQAIGREINFLPLGPAQLEDLINKRSL